METKGPRKSSARVGAHSKFPERGRDTIASRRSTVDARPRPRGRFRCSASLRARDPCRGGRGATPRRPTGSPTAFGAQRHGGRLPFAIRHGAPRRKEVAARARGDDSVGALAAERAGSGREGGVFPSLPFRCRTSAAGFRVAGLCVADGRAARDPRAGSRAPVYWMHCTHAGGGGCTRKKAGESGASGAARADEGGERRGGGGMRPGKRGGGGGMRPGKRVWLDAGGRLASDSQSLWSRCNVCVECLDSHLRPRCKVSVAMSRACESRCGVCGGGMWFGVRSAVCVRVITWVLRVLPRVPFSRARRVRRGRVR